MSHSHAQAIDFPELHQGLVDDATLDALANDLAACAELLEIRLKGGATRYSDDAPVDITEAVDALRQSRVRGVQLRYRYQGVVWVDTLVDTLAGIRLVRSRIPS